MHRGNVFSSKLWNQTNLVEVKVGNKEDHNQQDAAETKARPLALEAALFA